MASSRLPGKMMMEIHGRQVIEVLVARLEKAQHLDGIILATTGNPLDDPLAQWAETAGVAVHRGSEDDVLQRVVDAQRQMLSDVVVEVCGDCPLIDPRIVDSAIEVFRETDQSNRVVTTTRVPSYPDGMDVQVFRLPLLEEVARTVSDPAVREHVSLYFYEHPDQYEIIDLAAPAACLMPGQRCQLDYADDLKFLDTVLQRLEPQLGLAFSAQDVVRLLKENPEIVMLNAHCEEAAVR